MSLDIDVGGDGRVNGDPPAQSPGRSGLCRGRVDSTQVLELVTPFGASSIPWLHWLIVTFLLGGKPAPVTCRICPFVKLLSFGVTFKLGQYCLAAPAGEAVTAVTAVRPTNARGTTPATATSPRQNAFFRLITLPFVTITVMVEPEARDCGANGARDGGAAAAQT